VSSIIDENENDATACYKVEGQLYYLRLIGEGSGPGLDHNVLRFVDLKKQVYTEYETSEQDGIDGIITAVFATDAAPEFATYWAEEGYVPPVVGSEIPCNGSCVPPDWQKIIVDSSCGFLQQSLPIESFGARRPSH